MPNILDGARVAETIRLKIAGDVRSLKERTGIVPGIAFVTAGDDPASLSYVGMKERACKEIGMRSWQCSFPADVPPAKFIAAIEKLNTDASVHGILVQLPLPVGIDTYAVLSSVDPNKDVDGFNPVNMGKLLLGQEGFCPCTPRGVIELLTQSGESWYGKDVVIIGRSNIVGKPLAALLMQRSPETNATVTLCHTGTKDICRHTLQADIVVVAIGRAHFLKGDMVRDGAIVIDVGINRVPDKKTPRGYRLVGDVDYEEVSLKAKAISPVPGGVGPMTIAMLLANTLRAAKLINRL